MNILVSLYANISFSFLLGKYLGVELLSHREGICLDLIDTAEVFQSY